MHDRLNQHVGIMLLLLLSVTYVNAVIFKKTLQITNNHANAVIFFGMQSRPGLILTYFMRPKNQTKSDSNRILKI